MQSQCGPHGMQLTPTLQAMAVQNAPFSQLAWETAKQDGCQPCGNAPTWPPQYNSFVYPVQETPQEVMGLDMQSFESPFVGTMPGTALQSLSCSLPPQLRDSFMKAPLTVPDLAPASNGDKVAAQLPNSGTSEYVASAVPALMMNTARGIAYDLNNWSSLPEPTISGKVQYIVTRDDRLRFLGLWALAFIVLYVLARILF